MAAPELAHSVRQRILGLRARLESGFLELGALLACVEEYQLWHGYAESFREYCEDPEIGIPYGTVRKLIRLHRMAEALGVADSPELAEAGVSRAYAVLKASSSGEQALVRLREAKNLPVTEVQLMYRGEDPQVAAIERMLRRFDQLNSASRVRFMVHAYWRLVHSERLDFHAAISRARPADGGSS